MDSERKKVIARLRKIEGQVRGLQKMVESQAPCADILTQLSAVNSAVKKTGGLILQNYLRKCTQEALSDGPQGTVAFEKVLSRYIGLS